MSIVQQNSLCLKKGKGFLQYHANKALATTYFNDNLPYLSETVSGLFTTVGETGAILGYKMSFSFRDFNLEFVLYKAEPETDYIYNEFTPDSKYINITLHELVYDRIRLYFNPYKRLSW